MPDIDEDLDVDIKEDDLRIDTYRSSGAGGQHINKTSSAIRITHIPTGIVVQCQNERSQFQNKDKAMQMLKAKLYLLKQQENMEKLSGIRGEVTEIGWGNQIRSYVLQPYTMVKDHRTGVESGNVDSILDGNLDPFINGYLKWIALRRKTAGERNRRNGITIPLSMTVEKTERWEYTKKENGVWVLSELSDRRLAEHSLISGWKSLSRKIWEIRQY